MAVTSTPGYEALGDWVSGLNAATNATELARWKEALDQARAAGQVSDSLYADLTGMYTQAWQRMTGGDTSSNPVTPGGGGIPSTGPVAGDATQGTRTIPGEVASPFTEYMNMMGLGGRTFLSPGQQYLKSYAPAAENLWDVQSALAKEPQFGVQGMPGSFSEYMASAIPNTQAMGQRARDLLNTLFRGTNRPEDLSYEPTYDTLTGESGRGGIGELQQLVQTALRGRMAPRAFQYITGQLPELQQAWEQERAAGRQQTGGFLDYFKSRYNLGI